MINDTLKAGVYEIHEGMSVREVMELISNSGKCANESNFSDGRDDI